MKDLHKELKTDIQFLSQQAALYYNVYYSIEPILKEEDKVYLVYKNIKTKRPSNKLNNKKLSLFKIDKVIRLVNY